MSADPFGTSALRAAVLAAWAASPARLREDANAEEDHARGYYRDRVVVELAQNAADAAARAGVDGHLLLRLTRQSGRPVLVAANTGAPLDAAGVASLAALRASAKRDDDGGPIVGRFGVGFAAVRSVADEVTVASTSGAVHFSLARTREAVDALGDDAALRAEVERRRGSLPALRLPFDGPGPTGVLPDALPTADGPATAWATVVTLVLRDEQTVAEVRTQLAGLDDALLLALPSLRSVRIETDDAEPRLLADAPARWLVATRTGTVPRELLDGRPVEEAERDRWQVTWAVPRPGSPALLPGTVHAPTPTDEPCTVPALLIATFPLDPSRRHVSPGPLTDGLVEQAGLVLADLLEACRAQDGPDPLELLPTGLPSGALDAALHESALATARRVALLTPADGGPALAPAEAHMLAGAPGRDPALVGVLGRWLPTLVDVPPAHRTAARALGVRQVEVAEVVDALPALDPADLRRLLDAVAGLDRTSLEQLATLPVPLADGRTVRGVRGLVVLDGVDPELARPLTRWGLRVVDPGAAHPVLERLGAQRLDVAGVLDHPVLRSAVLTADPDADLLDGPADADPTGTPGHPDDGLGEEARTMLGLVAAALAAGALLEPRAWWGEVLLPAEDGEPVPAHGLVLPGSPAAEWFDDEVLPPLAQGVADRWAQAAVVLGVRSELAVRRLPAGWATGDDHDDADQDGDGGDPGDLTLLTGALDGWEDYLDHLRRAVGEEHLADLAELLVVADMDAVRHDAWPAVLDALTRGEPRRALLDGPRPASVPGTQLPTYTAWWLRHRADLGLERPFVGPGLERGAAARLLAPTPAVVAGLDAEVVAALGGVTDLAGLGAGWDEVLDALPPVGTPVEPVLAVEVWRGLVAAAGTDLVLDAERLPARTLQAGTVMADADEVVVADVMWAQVSVRPHLVVPTGLVEQVADMLDLDVAAEVGHGRLSGAGRTAEVPDAVSQAFPAAPSRWREHDDLLVDGVPVSWWVEEGDREPSVHASTTAGLARGLAWLVGWEHRATIERLVVEPDALPDLLVERAGDSSS